LILLFLIFIGFVLQFFFSFFYLLGIHFSLSDYSLFLCVMCTMDHQRNIDLFFYFSSRYGTMNPHIKCSYKSIASFLDFAFDSFFMQFLSWTHVI
jgi:hypothetical protein